MKIIFSIMCGSIIPLKSKLYYDEILFIENPEKEFITNWRTSYFTAILQRLFGQECSDSGKRIYRASGRKKYGKTIDFPNPSGG